MWLDEGLEVVEQVETTGRRIDRHDWYLSTLKRLKNLSWLSILKQSPSLTRSFDESVVPLRRNHWVRQFTQQFLHSTSQNMRFKSRQITNAIYKTRTRKTTVSKQDKLEIWDPSWRCWQKIKNTPGSVLSWRHNWAIVSALGVVVR